MNKYNPNIHHRRSIRLKGYDYSQAGLYFITICINNRKCLIGNIKNGEMIWNDAGKMIENEWLKITNRFKNTKLHEFIIMPNHFHAILEIVGATLVVAPLVVAPNDKGQPQGIAPTNTEAEKKPRLGDIVGAFLSITTVEYIRGVKNNNWKPFDRKLWQRNYWEHIIRSEKSYNRISEYIINNPGNWDEDKFHNC